MRSAERAGLAFLLTLASLPGYLGAQDYLYHPAGKLHLGIGFDPRTLDSRLGCIQFKQSSDVPLDVAALTTFDAYLVRSGEDLYRALSVDWKTSARVLAIGGGKSHYRVDLGQLRRRDALTIVITGTSAYNDVHADSVTLKPQYKALIDSSRMTAFASQCGTAYVSAVTRGNSISVVATVTGLSDSVRAKLFAMAKGDGSIGVASGSASLTLDAELRRASKEQRLTIAVRATGVLGGFAGLGDAIKAPPDGQNFIAYVQSKMGEFVKDRFGTPTITGYKVTPMTVFGYDPASADIWSDERELRLQELVREYRRLGEVVEDADRILSGQDARFGYYSVAGRNRLASARARWRARMGVLVAAHKSCLTSPAPTLCDSAPVDRTVPPDSLLLPEPGRPRGSHRFKVPEGIESPAVSAAFLERVDAFWDRSQALGVADTVESQVVFLVEASFVTDFGIRVGDTLTLRTVVRNSGKDVELPLLAWKNRTLRPGFLRALADVVETRVTARRWPVQGSRPVTAVVRDASGAGWTLPLGQLSWTDAGAVAGQSSDWVLNASVGIVTFRPAFGVERALAEAATFP